MIITNNYSNQSTSFQAATKRQMQLWKYLNKIPLYTNAAYDGYTGMKLHNFPTGDMWNISKYPDITEKLHNLETEIFQILKDTRKERFGYIKALWKLCQNLGTGEAWDTKFLPNFPGRNKQGKKQYAIYKGEIVSGNDLSNIIYGHICGFMGIPTKLAQIIAKLDAAGILEPFSKGKLPTFRLLMFRDTVSDQMAIAKGVSEFNIKDYNLK
ncbi:hypothetical protein IKL64_00170 [bacterium]|nr:hypothetical protein [bacterium]